MLKLNKTLQTLSKLTVTTVISLIAVQQTNAAPTIVDNLDTANSAIGGNYNPSNTSYRKGNPSSIPDGFESNYEYKHTDEGIEIDSSISAGFEQDFGEYINTSSENITLLDVTAGFDGGISLGCSGLDMGLEALFQFNAGDLLKNLPKYITTKLAVEALAQIYATPLISTVMDGLKAMQNWVAEMEQASCDMTTVMTKANQYKDERVDKCIADLTANGKSKKSAAEECKEPGVIDQMLKDKLNFIGGRESTGTSIAKLFSDNGMAYGDGNGDEAFNLFGVSYTTGKLAQMFIPDIKFSKNGGDSEYIEAPIDPGEVFNRSSNNAYNIITGIFKDVNFSIYAKDLILERVRVSVIASIQEYKNTIMAYGGSNIYNDNSGHNQKKYVDGTIKRIEEKFEKNHSVAYNTPKSATGRDLFKIGPKDGPAKTLSNSTTEFTGYAKTAMLNAGNECFVKSFKNIKEKTGPYTWKAIHRTPSAAFGSEGLTQANFSDEIIDMISTCKAIRLVNLPLSKRLYDIGDDLANSYFKKIAAQAALETTDSLVNVAIKSLNDAINNAPQKLNALCEKNGAAAMPKEAIYKGNGGQTFKSCGDYVEQNKPTEEKIKFFTDLQQSLTLSRDELKTHLTSLTEEYETMLTLATANKLN